MKKRNLTLAIVMASAVLSPANADVYVKVDANGNAIGGAIMCDSITCGAGSQYSRLTLNPGEQYVLQGTGQAGIGNNNPDTQVKVDLETKVWSVATPTQTQTFTDIETRPATPTPIQIPETTTVVMDTKTVINETQTAIDSITATTDFSTFDWAAIFEWLFKNWWWM